MFAIEFTLSLFTLIVMVGAAVLIGYSFRSNKLKKRQMKISELRKEMVSNHAHILELEKENVLLEKEIRANKTPVLSLKISASENKEEGRFMDSAI
jgi:hypothetical protein